MEIEKRIAIITGASRGIGLAAVSLFIDRGWHVISCSRDNSVECKNEKNWISHIPADLADAESLDNFINKVNENLNGQPVGALINNAGMSPKADNQERLGCLNGEIEAWREVFELNFYAPLKLGRGFAGALHKGSGAIVNVTSIAGHKIHPFAGSAYSSSKAALSALTREMANEFAALNVRVNAVAPGEISTSMIQPEYEMLIPRIPLNRMGTPEDVARSIHYLCSEDSEYVTGTEIWVTGGQHMP
jgi:NAD(P)-dependent dehydrogenase (short-subunit alcohol dehydrogenase family)